MSNLPAASVPSLEPDVAYCPPPDDGQWLRLADAHLLVVDKPAGLLTVPGRGAERADCLISRVQRHYPDALVVHRLDMATSGLVLFARGEVMQRELSALFRDRVVSKRYEARVWGQVAAESGLVDLPLITDWPRRPRQMVCHQRGKPAQTCYWRMDDAALPPDQSRVELEPITGRSHQLRVHLLSLGHPIVGDPLYGDAVRQATWPRMMLHATRLAFTHPATRDPVTVFSPAPF